MSRFRMIAVLATVFASLTLASTALASGGTGGGGTTSQACAKLSFSNGNFSVMADGSRVLSFSGAVENCGSATEALVLSFTSLNTPADFLAYDWNTTDAQPASMTLAAHTTASFYATPLGLSAYVPGHVYDIRVSTRLAGTSIALATRDFSITAPA